MYRRPKFIEALHKIRQEMAAEADHDVILFAEKVRNGAPSAEPFADKSRSADAESERAGEPAFPKP